MSIKIQKKSAARNSTIEELEMLQKLDKIYEAIGREPLYQSIIDDAPNLLREDDMEIRLKSQENCFAAHLYVFDRYMIVAKPVSDDKSFILPEVWFGIQSALRDIEQFATEEPQPDENNDDDELGFGLEDINEQEMLDRLEKKKYSVIAWYDLARLKSHSIEEGKLLKLTFTKVERDQIELSEDIIKEHTKVENSSVFLPLSKEAKLICELVHENIRRLDEEDEEDLLARYSFGEASVIRKDTEGKSNIMEIVPLEERLSINVEAASFTVLFKGHALGFMISTVKDSEPFVSDVIKGSLADYAGVVVSDKIISVNGNKLLPSTTSEECTKLIGEEKKSGQIQVEFLRNYEKQKELDKTAEVGLQQLKPKPFKPKSDTKTRRVSNATIDSKTSRNSAITSHTSKRKIRKRSKGTRSFADKLVGIKYMSYLVTTVKDIKDMKKRAPGKMKRLIEGMLKEMMEQNKEHRTPLNVLGVISELYRTEFDYIANLNSLRGCQIKLKQAKVYVPCNKLRNGKLFCEHKNIRLRCTKKSKIRERIVTKAELDPIFLNLVTVIKASLFLFNSINRGLSKLANKYEENKTAESKEKVEICDLVNECCDRYADIAPFLQMFWDYCRRFTSACTHLKSLRQKNPHFAEQCKILETKFGKKIPNLMQSPVSRITRYHLLFNSMLSYMKKYQEYCKTNNECTESQDLLTKTVNRVDAVKTKLFVVANKVNLKVGNAKELDSMVAVYDEIGGDTGVKYLLQPYRRFIGNHRVGFENTYQFVEKNKDVVEPDAALYIFNDMIVVASLRKAKRKSFGSFKEFVLRHSAKHKSNRFKSPISENNLTVTKASEKKHKTDGSTGSNGSKSKPLFVYIDVVFDTKLSNIKALSKESEKTADGENYALRCVHTKKTGANSFETSNIAFWCKTAEERDNIEEILASTKEEHHKQVLANKEARARHGSFRKIG